jgi:protocatechuate 3,4-dioxygenase beta subunit
MGARGKGRRVPSPAHQLLRAGIGLTRRLVTTIFFSEGPDPVFDWVPSAMRPRLIALRDPSLDEEDLPAYRFDVILRGDGETSFFLN